MINEREQFLSRIQALAAQIELGMNCDLIVGVDSEVPDGRFYLQVTCWRKDAITGEMGRGYGGKAYLSPHMTNNEIVQCAFGLYKGYWEHEARETFTYRERRVFGPHINVDALWEVARRVDIRSAKHVEDKA